MTPLSWSAADSRREPLDDALEHAAARLLDGALDRAPEGEPSAEPWLFTTTPRSPSSVAPL